jgi:bisphosphoglycerate-independent phosphoglycerate mutase (AlkP superfamily)
MLIKVGGLLVESPMGKQNSNVGHTYLRVGRIYHETRQLEEALTPRSRKAADIFEATLGRENSIVTVRALYSISMVLVEMGWGRCGQTWVLSGSAWDNSSM